MLSPTSLCAGRFHCVTLRATSVWPVAHAVCAHLQDPAFFAPHWWAGKRVLELGAGTGIVGMCAAVLIATADAAAADTATAAAAETTTAAGTLAPPNSICSTLHSVTSLVDENRPRDHVKNDGACVCLTDIGRHVDLLRRNVALNVADLRDLVTVCDFQWGTSIDALPGPFDVIVGSDITYDADYFDVLLDSIDALCSSSDRDTLVIIGLQQRDRDDCIQLFAKLSARFRFVKVPVAAAHAHPLLGVFHIRQRRRRQRLQCAELRTCAPLPTVPGADNVSHPSVATRKRSDEAETIRLPPQARRAFAMAK